MKLKFFTFMRSAVAMLWPDPDAYMYWDRKVLKAREEKPNGQSYV